MFEKRSIEQMAIFGGECLFKTARSTSNLLKPDFQNFLNYSKVFFDQHQYTNNGPNVKLLERRLAEFHQAKHCITFSSGFWALAIAIRAIAIKGKTEIVMPSLTYRRMSDMAAWVKLKPNFCEVEPKSLAMSAATVRPCVNNNTALILGVHPIVNCCDVEGLVALSKETGIPILFDSVESVYESVASGKIGKYGEAECFSLHACKLLNGFGGGYLTTNNRNLAEKLASMRSFGFVNIDSVATSDGMNSKLNEIHAAMALASLDDLENQVERNRERYFKYKSLLQYLPGIELLEFDEKYQSAYKNIVVKLLDDWPLSRADTIKILNAENILARSYYYPPLHRKPMEYSYIPADLPVTDMLAGKFINLPCGQLVSNNDIEKIVQYLKYISLNAKIIAKYLRKSGKP